MDSAYIYIIVDFLSSFILGVAIIRLLLRVAYHNRLFDMPGQWKVHSIPVPRLGGMAFLPTLLVVFAFTIASLYRLEMVHTSFADNILFEIKNGPPFVYS